MNKKFEDYIGRYYERKLPEEQPQEHVFKIKNFDGKYFSVQTYNLYLGFSTMEINLKMLPTFLEKEYFKEISKSDFELVENLCIDPYVADYTDNDENPKCYQILKRKIITR